MVTGGCGESTGSPVDVATTPEDWSSWTWTKGGPVSPCPGLHVPRLRDSVWVGDFLFSTVDGGCAVSSEDRHKYSREFPRTVRLGVPRCLLGERTEEGGNGRLWWRVD